MKKPCRYLINLIWQRQPILALGSCCRDVTTDFFKCATSVVKQIQYTNKNSEISNMAQDKDFLQDIKASLISSGELGRLRAAVRSSIINIASGQTVKGPLNNEIDFCNRLVKEYLEWNKYIYTSSMLSAESGMSDERVSREMLAREVGVNDNENSLQIPLLLSMTLMYKAENKT